MADKKPADYSKGLRDREMEIKMGSPSQEDMDALIKFEEKGKKPVPKPKRKPKAMAKGGKVGKYNCSHNRLY